MKVWTFVVLTFLAHSAWAERSEFRIQELSTVRVGDPIRFGAIAIGDTKDFDLAEKLYSLQLFPAMTEEGIKEIDSKDLAIALRAKLSFLELQRLAVKIPDKFRIRAQKNFIYPTDVRNQLVLAVQKFCPGCEVQIEDLRIPNVKGKEEVLNVRIDASNVHNAGNFYLPMIVENSRGRDQYYITGKIVTLKRALIAKRLLKQGERVTREDFEEKLTNVSFVRDGLPGFEEIKGKALLRTLQIGQPVFFMDLKKELALQRGQPVRILIESGPIEIVGQGTAEESGAVGDTVKVKNSEQKLFSGTIIEQGIVRIQ